MVHLFHCCFNSGGSDSPSGPLFCYNCSPRAPPPRSVPSVPPILQIDGPLVGRQDIPKLAFIKTSFKDAIKGSLVEPRRAAISLDYNYRVQQVRQGRLNASRLNSFGI